ncbi:dihydrodipicolinate reductase [Rhodococcus sp. HNM0569]|uniref:NAD(P)H-dependent amine dehydrogenase family protein n=1 Tax=Rhodococcus sp. HNM0569 TaxID=2716340 RepID=UPI00146B7C7A|nr:dihydrodipicolinate reductase [Rhodococcus sp. HNM0569]NLU84750.1 dihydrodipicolinate reductase [Rhodococcus sp. HNM0569]
MSSTYSGADAHPLQTVVWGTGNVGRAAIRAVQAHPALALSGVVVHSEAKIGVDAGELAGLPTTLGVPATGDLDAALAGADAVVYAASGDLRPDDALADVLRAVRAGAVVVTPSLFALYDPPSAPADVRDAVDEAIATGGGALFVSGVDPGWANDILPLLASGLASSISQLRCQEIFDYTTYDQPDAVRILTGMGQPMDYEPPMLVAGVPTMVWGGQLRLLGRALGIEFDDIVERHDRRALTDTVDTPLMGRFDAGTQGAVRFELEGHVAGDAVVVVEHVTRIDAACAPDWPQVPDGGAGVHRVIVEGRPRIEIDVVATDEGGNRAAGGNATAVGRLVNAIPWLRDAGPGLYDALDVPIQPGVGKLGKATLP